MLNQEDTMKKILMTAVAGAMLAGMVPVHAEDHLVWKTGSDGRQYWYEHGKKQGAKGDPKNIIDSTYGYERGREIYDPASDAWYWLDAIYDGARACDKEVWMPYVYQDDLKTGKNPEGKWVRYNSDGAMIKGWYTPVGSDAELYPDHYGKIYHYDQITGAMAKGWSDFDEYDHYFYLDTGVLWDPVPDDMYSDDLDDFITLFLQGYSGRYFYSSANPLINPGPVVLDVLGHGTCFPLDYSVGPVSYNYVVSPDASDPLGWFPASHADDHGYIKYDADKVDWLVENVLNLSQFVAKRQLDMGYDIGHVYRYDFGSDHAYYAAAPQPGDKPSTITAKIINVRMDWNLYVVNYEFGNYGYMGYDHILGVGKMYLLLKRFNDTPYWSVLADDREWYKG